MNRIIYYKGDITPEAFRTIKAEIDFSSIGTPTGIVNKKLFKEDEIKKGFEALKRWISTSSFETILIINLFSALEKGDFNGHIVEWLSEHKTESGFPNIVVLDKTKGNFPSLKVEEVDTLEELRTLI